MKIIIFGTGNGYERIKNDIDFSNVNIVAFCDNDKKKWGKSVDNKRIISPNEVVDMEYDYIFVASMYYKEITEQLLSLGIGYAKIIPYFKPDYISRMNSNILRIIKKDVLIKKKIEDVEMKEKENQKYLENTMFLMAKLNIERISRLDKVEHLSDAEFKVFSQWGEDGIIQYLISRVPIENKVFIEFGVENYTEANTRFLLMNNNWSGLIIDGSDENIDYVKNDEVYWRYDLKAKTAFITKNNINDIIKNSGIEGDIGILSVDIDGNDYWVWDSINVVNPRIIICEYNSIFGYEKQVTNPYADDFRRVNYHFSNLCYGASLAALCSLAEKKGYDFVGSNSAGNNAFFVRKDLSEKLRKFTPKSGYVESKYRESRNQNGKLNFISGKERLETIKDMELYDLQTNRIKKIKDLFELC